MFFAFPIFRQNRCSLSGSVGPPHDESSLQCAKGIGTTCQRDRFRNLWDAETIPNGNPLGIWIPMLFLFAARKRRIKHNSYLMLSPYPYHLMYHIPIFQGVGVNIPNLIEIRSIISISYPYIHGFNRAVCFSELLPTCRHWIAAPRCRAVTGDESSQQILDGCPNRSDEPGTVFLRIDPPQKKDALCENWWPKSTCDDPKPIVGEVYIYIYIIAYLCIFIHPYYALDVWNCLTNGISCFIRPRCIL